jgi:hypothetical protein
MAAARLEIGDVYAREPKSVLAEFFVPALLDANGGVGDAGEVRVAELVVVAHVLTEQGGWSVRRSRSRSSRA